MRAERPGGLNPFFELHPKEHADRRKKAKPQGKGIAVRPFQLGEMLEIHPVDACHNDRRHGHGGENRQMLQDLVPLEKRVRKVDLQDVVKIFVIDFDRVIRAKKMLVSVAKIHQMSGPDKAVRVPRQGIDRVPLWTGDAAEVEDILLFSLRRENMRLREMFVSSSAPFL